MIYNPKVKGKNTYGFYHEIFPRGETNDPNLVVEYNPHFGGYLTQEELSEKWGKSIDKRNELLNQNGFGDPEIKKFGDEWLTKEILCTRCGESEAIAFGYAGHALCNKCFDLFNEIINESGAYRGQIACACGAIGSHLCPITNIPRESIKYLVQVSSW